MRYNFWNRMLRYAYDFLVETFSALKGRYVHSPGETPGSLFGSNGTLQGFNDRHVNVQKPSISHKTDTLL